MDIEISGTFYIKFSPDLHDDMTRDELIEAKVYDYIVDKIEEGDCVVDSWNYGYIRDTEDYYNILNDLEIDFDSGDDIESFLCEYMEYNYFKEFQSNPFKHCHFEESYDLNSFSITFYVTLQVTVEDICRKYLETV